MYAGYACIGHDNRFRRVNCISAPGFMYAVVVPVGHSKTRIPITGLMRLLTACDYPRTVHGAREVPRPAASRQLRRRLARPICLTPFPGAAGIALRYLGVF